LSVVLPGVIHREREPAHIPHIEPSPAYQYAMRSGCSGEGQSGSPSLGFGTASIATQAFVPSIFSVIVQVREYRGIFWNS
jgi:hypothetical protein